jgi:hypothetical protein
MSNEVTLAGQAILNCFEQLKGNICTLTAISPKKNIVSLKIML